ncbi:uncharacterized protein LOC132722973 isoform X2 [Ruditapes philippinarum]|uniref:uncharacterized protein LOC132722973 isoform X2 n=1 Tax=Ruditapes philippinarum TaxID=129788 RepID=UPI00295B28BF|nr:uncharacterized protein LOC132722973 isoform X2 [Ruditapes philippinarum]
MDNSYDTSLGNSTDSGYQSSSGIPQKEFHDKNDTNSNNKHIKNIKDSKLLTPATSWKIEETICICSHFRFLKREIYLKPLVDLFFQNGDFDEDDMEEILHQQRRRRQSVDIFLRKLLRLKTGSFDIFLRFLRQTEQEHIAYELEMAPSVCEDLDDTHQSEHDMETSILMNLELLCDDLEPDKVADFFLQYRVFSIDEYESVISHRNRRKKAEEMVGLILENLPRSFLILRLTYRKMGNKQNILQALDAVKPLENQDDINMKIREHFEMKRRDLNCTCMLYPTGFFNVKMRLQTKDPQDAAFERNIVESLQVLEVVEEINQKLRKFSNCQVQLVDFGSVVLYLLNCGPLLREKSDIPVDVDTLLRLIFLHPAVGDFGCYKGLRFNVTIEELTLKSIEEPQKCGHVKREAVQRNIDFLAEELSIWPFVHHKKVPKLFKKSEIDSVLNGASKKRKKRMHVLLSLILSRGDPAVRFFEMVLKEEKQTDILKRLCNFDSIEGSSPTGSYAALIDEMSPSLVIDECKTVGIDIGKRIEKENSLTRRKMCEVILEHAVCQDHETKQKIFWILGKNYPDQVDFRATSSQKISYNSNSYSTIESEEDNLTKLYEGNHHIDKPDFDQMGRSIQPDYLTTRSQYRRVLNETRDSDIMENIQYQETYTCDLSRSNKSDASSGYCTDKEHK